MAKEISWEIREQAEELYIVDGKTFEEVAEITGVSIGQLKRWGAGRARGQPSTQSYAAPGRSEVGDQEETEKEIPSWTDRKKEYRTAFANIRRDTILLRKRLISKALKSLDPQDVYAISSLESTVAKVQQTAGADMAATGLKEKRIIKTPQDAVDALGDVVENKINGMLTKPGAINFAAIKEMKQALELIDKMKEKYDTKDKKASKKQLDPETIETIRREIYGL